MPTKIALFDLDGVLVQPGGYRESIQATLNYFLEEMNLSHLKPGEDVIAHFESIGITNEWDMVPICLSIILENVLKHSSAQHHWNDYKSAATSIKENPPDNLFINYPSFIEDLEKLIIAGEAPSETLLHHSLSTPEQNLLPNLAHHNVIKELLSCTRDLHHSITTRIFQNFVLGSQVYQETYHLPAEHASGSFLLSHDKALLDPSTCKKIQHLLKIKYLNAVIYTARPSLPPSHIEVSTINFPPEAEMAAELVGLNNIPLMGYGRLTYAAQQYHLSPVQLVKPQPFQALAAIGSALCQQEWPALQWAAQISQFHNLPAVESSSAIELPQELEINVFEDSPIGITAVQKAVKALAIYNTKISVFAWGIAKNPNKVKKLEAVGAHVCENINIALHKAFAEIH